MNSCVRRSAIYVCIYILYNYIYIYIYIYRMAGNFGGFPIFYPPKLQCDVIIIAKSCVGLQLNAPV